MIKVVIGSMVLCHLIMPGTPTTSSEESQKIMKILGEVKDIQKSSRYIEKVENKEALRVDKDILVVQGKNKEGLYQIDSRACMVVRDESLEERENRLFPKKKIVVDEQGNEVSEEELKESLDEKEDSVNGLEIQNQPAIEAEKKQVIPEVIINKPIEEKKIEPKKEEVKKEEPKKAEIKEDLKKEVKQDTKVESKKEEKGSFLDYIK